jgi:hypothetical protein
MFTPRNTSRFNPRQVLAAVCAAGALAFAAAPAHAAGIPGLNLYMGAGLGQSNADLSDGDIGATDFDKKDMGWKVFVGGRFLSYFGAELDYIDFGKPAGDDAELKYKALAGFGLFYMPIPLPILDLYIKAGMAKLDYDLDVDLGAGVNTKDTKFAYGGGLQLKFGSWAIRGEYEQFKAEGSKPSMLSLSFSKSFL